MKKIAIAGVCMALSAATYANIVITKDVRGAATWDAFTVTTMGSSDPSSTATIANNNTVGIGQSLTITQSGYIDAISFAVTRMYANMDGVVTVYQMFGGDGVTPDANPTRFRVGNTSWVSDPVATINFNTTAVNINNSADGNNMYTFNLTGADQIAVAAGETYLIQLAGTAGGSGGNLALWDRAGNVYADGLYGYPDGSLTIASTDAAVAVNVIPEPATIGLIGVFGAGLLALRRYRTY